MSAGATRIAVIAVYFAIVLVIGALAFRKTETSAEDYFLGRRSAKTVVLFMALFGTNITPFVLMGIPAKAYHAGIAMFGLNAAIIVLGIPLTFWLIGYPAWIAAKATGAVTPAELYAKRFGARWLGWLLFGVFSIYTIPYMATAVIGVGTAVDVLSEQALSFELAALGILVITLLYTSLGGMKATMWTNVFQGAVFMGFSLVAFWLIAGDFGGLDALMQGIHRDSPQLFERPSKGLFSPRGWASWALAIALTVIAFPHMLVRIFAAKDAKALKNACRYYPPAMVLLWIPATLFGVWATVDHPGLAPDATDVVFPLLVLDHLGPLLEGLALAGILAAVMSTLDAQMLTLSSMLTRDVLPPQLAGRHPVRISRVFLVALALLTYGLALWGPASIFDLAGLSFSGYVTLVPTLFLGLRWRRFTVWGAATSIVLGNLVFLAAVAGFVPTFGFLPVVWGLGAAIVGALVGSWMSAPTETSVADAVLAPIEAVLGHTDRA